MAYAVETKVSVEKTQAEIRKMVGKAGATSFAYLEEFDRVHVAFRISDRNVRFTVCMPLPENRPETEAMLARRMKLTRSRWRALMLVIRAKLESVESGIETFEEAFLAHIQTPSGRTVMEEIRAPLALSYREGRNVPLLPSPK